MKKVLITGGTGFVGSQLVRTLSHENEFLPIVGVRKIDKSLPSTETILEIGDISADTALEGKLSDIDTIIHLAARVHVMQDQSNDPLHEFRKVNTEGTLRLARHAATEGVKRFVFLSSIKVNGEMSSLNKPFTPEDKFIPVDPYGLSKYEAEKGLREIADSTGLEVVIIRPPLVYGPGVKANFLNMIKLLSKGIPLPLGAIKNCRSLVSIHNLVDLIIVCMEHPLAVNQTFLVSDDEDLSTTSLLQRLGSSLGKPARLLPVPQKLFVIALGFIGKSNVAQRLCGSLQVDISKTKNVLGWAPPVSVDQAFDLTAQHFLKSKL